MKTYEDLLEVINDEGDLMEFTLEVINDHKTSEIYKDAQISYDYYRKRNKTITEFQKLLYTLSGEAVPDNFSANFKFINAFFPIFVKQEASHLLGNGVTFNEEGTKDRLGGDKFDTQLIKAGKAALWGAISFGFFNYDHVDIFDILEYAPLWGEEDGGLHAGVRFWQISENKPLRATLYMEDGYIEYTWREGKGSILKDKTPYMQITATSEADGTEIIDGQNYEGFPIVPLWGNEEHQSSFVGLRSKIDGYDLIQSGFANDLDEASQIYWIIQNADGMDDIDLKKFLERLKIVKAANVDGGTTAEAHTIEVPYQARQQALAEIRDSLYRDAMALDTDKITAGSITATAINAAYENLTLKCDDFETNVTEFIRGLLDLIGIDDSPTYQRSKIVNVSEDTQVVLSAADYLDDETILKHLPFINVDEVESILEKKDEENAERLEGMFTEEGEDEEGYVDAEGIEDEDSLNQYGNEVIAMLEELVGEL